MWQSPEPGEKDRASFQVFVCLYCVTTVDKDINKWFPYVIAKHLVQWTTYLRQAVHSCQPQSQEAVVDALHEEDLAHDEDRVPDVTAEVTSHVGLGSCVQAWRMLKAGPDYIQLAHLVGSVCDPTTWNATHNSTAVKT